MAEPNSYEEQRRRQVEENKRKLEELCLHRLSAAVKPMPTKQLKLRKAAAPPALTQRSGRVASLLRQPDYRNIPHTHTNPKNVYLFVFDKSILSGTYVSKTLPPDLVYVAEEARAYAFSKAKELKNQLCSDHPSFIKPISNYAATSSWLNIRSQVNKRYLTWSDEMVFLVDEEDGEFHMPYHALSGSFGNGWKWFAIGHKLADGDCLVFHLVEKTKFKVYIIRASSYYEKDLLTPLAQPL
ncbi:B3 domain-containing protein Os06g0194400-like [Aegilops tauschii subsp. strangulata]|uniref:B3 domain-containing protein Os06g0194400-like n=1 Tax=Aegilops tauschii subsp. strangulata TaxID=200361 RepID=UPI003CC877B9